MSTIATDTELKALKGQATKTRNELADANRALNEARDIYNTLKSKLEGLQARIGDIEKAQGNQGVTVSEHALVRWFERALGFEINEVTQQMISPRVEAAIRTLKTCNVKTDQGYTLVVKNCVVVTVLED